MSEHDSSPLTRDIAPFGVRMPPELKERVQAAAKANNRSMNAEIVATLEEKYPAPIRSFNFEKFEAYRVFAEDRSKEILAELDNILSRYRDPHEKIEVLRQQFEELIKEHRQLWNYDVEDDRFHDIEYPTPDD